MKFEEALQAVREGKKVRRTNNANVIIDLKLYTPNKTIRINEEDFLAEDWEIVD